MALGAGHGQKYYRMWNTTSSSPDCIEDPDKACCPHTSSSPETRSQGHRSIPENPFVVGVWGFRATLSGGEESNAPTTTAAAVTASSSTTVAARLKGLRKAIWDLLLGMSSYFVSNAVQRHFLAVRRVRTSSCSVHRPGLDATPAGGFTR